MTCLWDWPISTFPYRRGKCKNGLVFSATVANLAGDAFRAGRRGISEIFPIPARIHEEFGTLLAARNRANLFAVAALKKLRRKLHPTGSFPGPIERQPCKTSDPIRASARLLAVRRI